MWSVADIADVVEAGVRAEVARLADEQAVYGLDALDEVRLHPYIERWLGDAGFGVHREQRYPAERGKRRATEGERCDFVLTQDARPLHSPDAAATLFDPPDAVALEDAFWLEVKVVAQFTVEGPNRGYSSQLLSTVREDLRKISKDRGILHAAVLIILFAQDDAVADHDLRLWYERCVERGLPVGFPSRRAVAITNRHGNGVCAIAMCPSSHF